MRMIRDRLVGGTELLFLFGRGADRFSGTRAEAAWSVIVPVLVYATGLAVGGIWPPKGMEQGYAPIQILGTRTVHFLLSFLFGSLLIAVSSRLFGLHGVPDLWMSYVHFRVVALPSESASDSTGAKSPPVPRPPETTIAASVSSGRPEA